MREKISLIGDLQCPKKAYDTAKSLASMAVENQAVMSGTKDKAITDLTSRYGFQSFLRKLHRGEKVSLHVHLYVRLCQAVEETAASLERKIAHDRLMSRAARGDYETSTGTISLDDGNTPVFAGAV